MDVVEWLLASDNPSVRYRTLVELMGRGGSEEALEAKKAILESKPVRRLMDAMHPDGYWLQKNYKGRIIGDGVEYGSFGTTHFCLSYCAELGLDRSQPFIQKAASRYLGLQKEDGDGWEHLLLSTKRSDGGYLCDMHEKGKPPKSCIRGSAKALLAFSVLPEYWEHERCMELVDYFLNRNGIYRKKDPKRFVSRDMEADSYPITWGTNVWEILYALSRMGYGRDERLRDAWTVMESRKDADGRYLLHRTPGQRLWNVGKAGEPNQWITLYCMLAEKYKKSTCITNEDS